MRSMSFSKKIFFSIKIIYQITILKLELNKNPDFFKKIFYQGVNLKRLTSLYGIKFFICKIFKDDFDIISANHGITRINIGRSNRKVSYKNQKFSDNGLIWDYRPRMRPFIDDDQTIKFLESNFQAIKDEYALIASKRKKFPDSDTLSNPNGLWAYLPFFGKNGEPNEELLNICPNISKITKKLNINKTYGFVFFSILKPGTHLESHCGSTSFRQRYHLGIEVPEPDLSYIKVLNKTIKWKEGKSFSFNDSYIHEVRHNGKKERVVFIIDVWSEKIPIKHRVLIEKLPLFKKFGVY